MYRFLVDDADATHTPRRCRAAMHPNCACANEISPPPSVHAPPPPTRFTEQWERVDPPAESLDSSRGALHALTQRLVNGRTLDLSLRTGPMYAFQVRRASPSGASASPTGPRTEPQF